MFFFSISCLRLVVRVVRKMIEMLFFLRSSSKIHIIRIIAIVIYNNNNHNIVTHHIIDGHAQTQRMAFKDTSCP